MEQLMAKILFLGVILSFCGVNIYAQDGDSDVSRSIVRIYSVFADYDYLSPWQMRSQRERTGSGGIIDGNKILTNAHIVSNALFIQVRKAGEAKRYTARVSVISHASDLAVLEVEDVGFFKNTPYLEIGTLPPVRSRVAVYGFPTGGDELSITEGVVSRIEHRYYTHSNARLLVGQIDAAINPGNSGGPVLKDNKIVGVAFQAMLLGDNIGYMIPEPVITHFLQNTINGVYQGIPELGVDVQKMNNRHLREKYGVKEPTTGVLITHITHLSSAHGKLLVGDVITEIGGVSVENDGSVEFRRGERTDFNFVVQNKRIGDNIEVTVIRNGEKRRVVVNLHSTINSNRLVHHQQYDIAPTYFIYGGFVFSVVTQNYLKEWGRSWFEKAPLPLLNYYFNGRRTKEREEIVVVIKVLADKLTEGYQSDRNFVISKINGEAIKNIRHALAILDNAKGDFVTIEAEDGDMYVLNRKKAMERNPSILKKFRISSDRSEDLR